MKTAKAFKERAKVETDLLWNRVSTTKLLGCILRRFFKLLQGREIPDGS